MTDVIFGMVILGLLLYMAWEKRETRREQAKLIHALVSKTPEQMRDLELTDKVEPIKAPLPDPEPELVHESEMPQDQFEEMIRKEVG